MDALRNLPSLNELDRRNNGTEIISLDVVDDVENCSEASLNNQKTVLIDQSKQNNQVTIPVKVGI